MDSHVRIVSVPVVGLGSSKVRRTGGKIACVHIEAQVLPHGLQRGGWTPKVENVQNGRRKRPDAQRFAFPLHDYVVLENFLIVQCPNLNV